MADRNVELRDRLLRKWKTGCIFCCYNRYNTKGQSLLEAAHIRSFSENYGYDTLNNLILLCRNHHAEYDNGLIDFDTSGKIYCIDQDDPLNGKIIPYYPGYIVPGYILYHNQESEVGRKLIVKCSQSR